MVYNVNFLQSFLVILLLAYENKFYLQVYLDNCAYKIVQNQIIRYIDENHSDSDEDKWVL